MSGYNMEHFLKDFANRTIHNLQFIEERSEQYSLYEVTQLINSLLGLIIIPVEAYKKTCKINDKILVQLSEKDYNTINNILNTCKLQNRLYSDYRKNRSEEQKERLNVSNFISHLRNAIAHGGNNGIHFYPVSEYGTISSVIFYDNNEINHKKEINEFCIKLTVDELRILVVAISNLYCQFEKRNFNVLEKQEKYVSDIKSLEDLLKDGRTDKTKVIFKFEGSGII